MDVSETNSVMYHMHDNQLQPWAIHMFNLIIVIDKEYCNIKRPSIYGSNKRLINYNDMLRNILFIN